MTYDDAGWHQDTVDEAGLEESAAVIHIAGFLAWCGRAGLIAPEFGDGAAALAARTAPPADIAEHYFDAQIDPSMLTEEGNQFAQDSYRRFLESLEISPLLERHESVYHMPNTWQSVDEIAQILTALHST